MIPYIDTQLSIWGKAQINDVSRGLGYASVSPMFRDVKHGGVYGSAPPLGVSMTDRDNVEDTEQAVKRLDCLQRRLCIEYYVIGGTACDIAQRMGIAKRTLYDRLHALHQAMIGLLNDVIIGIEPGVEKAVDVSRTVSV